MRIITIVGVQNSGKTNTLISLIEAIRRRGKKFGICKTIDSPTFTLAPSSSNIKRFRRSGSELVCTRSKGETAFLHPEELPLSKVLEHYKDCDYVLLENDYLAPVPRIVCAQREEDALLCINSRTLAFAGCISENPAIELPLPCYNALTDAESLLNYIDQKIPNIFPCSLLDTQLPPVAGVTDNAFFTGEECLQNCSVEAESLQVIFEGKKLSLTANQQAELKSWIKSNINRI